MSRAASSSISVSAPAKINLTLDVLGRRPDGYHEIASIMQTISLADKITVTLAPDGTGISLSVTGLEAEGVPKDEKNLVWRAAQGFGAKNVAIHIEKNIPSQAGLGGGSSDAAATLMALNKLAGGKFSRDHLVKIGMNLGADIPFFLHGGIARVGGIGEKVTPMPQSPGFFLVIVKSPVNVATLDAYRLLDEISHRRSAQATNKWPHGGFANDFEHAIYPRYPEIARARDALLAAGTRSALLCGSGAAVFGTTNEPERVVELVRAANVGRFYIAHTIGKGER